MRALIECVDDKYAEIVSIVYCLQGCRETVNRVMGFRAPHCSVMLDFDFVIS